MAHASPGGGRSLLPAENERLRRFIQIHLNSERNQTKLAAKLGVSQPTLSAFLRGRQGSSFGTARRACALVPGADVLEVLGMAPSKGKPELRLREIRGYEAAIESARQRFPHIPESAWGACGAWVVLTADGAQPELVTSDLLLEISTLVLRISPPEPTSGKFRLKRQRKK